MNTWSTTVVVAALVAGCHPTAVDDTTGGGPIDVDRGSGDDGAAGGGGGDVAKVLADAQAALAELDADIVEAEAKVEGSTDPALVEALLALQHDRTAHLGFITHVERCAADAAACPPSFDEPTIAADYDPATGSMTGKLAGDVSTWPAAAEDLAVAACGCRTRTCVDWILADLARWETALTPHEQDTDDATRSVTTARECLWTRLGH